MPDVRPPGVPFMLVRGGTSRGAFFRKDDLPDGPVERDRAILRAFRGDQGVLADGVGGENPVLRKVAVVYRRPDEEGRPALGYDFAQVATSLDHLDRTVECGNIAAGVPLFATLCNLIPAPEDGGRVRIILANSNQRMDATWLTVIPGGGTLRLEFPGLPGGQEQALPLGEPMTVLEFERPVALSVVRGLNTYLFIRSRDLGLPDPVQTGAISGLVFEHLERVVGEVRRRMATDSPLKVCLVEGRAATEPVRARIVYPAERRLHPSFAVTGATTLALGRTIPGTILYPPEGLDVDHRLLLTHPSGTLELDCALDESGWLRTAALERSCRLIAEGRVF